jgi:predicted ATPase
MRLDSLEIQNYKSLRTIAIEPTPLSVLVGPNASGKTNFADALDFLGIAYRWGLEQAVAAKGGYENICYRSSSRRSKAPVIFRVSFRSRIEDVVFDLDHDFELKTKSQGIASPFVVEREAVTFSYPGQDSLIYVSREGAGVKQVGLPKSLLDRQPPVPTQLILPSIQHGSTPLRFMVKEAGSLRVFQLNPRTCREAGAPIPNAELDRFGGNLPAALDHLKKNFPESYAALLETVRKVLPSVESLDTGFTHTKTLALFLRERGFGRPWPAEDISDGTLQTIALLVALFDPRSKIVVIEEPENSIHPWALRHFVEAARQASTQKQVFLTTHSPVLIDQLRPEELWVVRRPGAETLIDPLPRLDPAVTEAWGQGKFTLSEYLDSGALPDAVPAAGSGR